MNNIIFIGMPAVGKSTIGVITAKRLGFDFIDTDLLIQQTQQRLLKDIIEQEGIGGFLEIEDRINASLTVDQAVISPGGSVVYCENAMKHYTSIGRILYLKASYETINKRLSNAKGRGVVLRSGQTLKDLYEERVPLFERYAHITVNEDGLSLEETIESVIEAIKGDDYITNKLQ